MDIFSIIIIALLLINVVITIFAVLKGGGSKESAYRIEDLSLRFSQFESNLKEDFRTNREEGANTARDNRIELNNALNAFKAETTENFRAFTKEQQEKFGELKTEQQNLIDRTVQGLEKITAKIEEKFGEIGRQSQAEAQRSRDALEKVIKNFQEAFDRNVKSFNDLQLEKFGNLEKKQQQLVESTEKKLEEMRVTVDEKLQKTLSERLSQSFDMVGRQLESVQKGLGEMQTLAQDVGGLKRVLSNVKMRGGFGEVQLSMLLEQILAPEQYEANVKTGKGSSETVEFAIKLPGKDDVSGNVWLPVDAKFPREAFEKLQIAYESNDTVQAEEAQKALDAAIRKMARDIRDKYINPPDTTDFAIMFLPFEGIYAEVVRKASLLEELQRDFKVIVTGPTTLAAILNSLQMGFRTLAIQKRSSEVWKILGAVKKEFGNFGGLLEKAQKNLQTASNQIDEVMGKRTRAIRKKLKDVEVLNETETRMLLPEITDAEITDDDTDE